MNDKGSGRACSKLGGSLARLRRTFFGRGCISPTLRFCFNKLNITLSPMSAGFIVLCYAIAVL